jgi:2-methylcitrate dehydratase
LALMVAKGEMGLPSVLSAPIWGFYDVLFNGRPFAFQRPYGSYVMENVLFKLNFPAEFHAQTAVECALQLHPQVKDRLDDIDRIELKTQESGVRISSKDGPLHNPADRDHCLQYMVAVPLIFGRLTADDYEDRVAADPRIDALRERMVVNEDPRYSEAYLDPDKRAIGNAVQIFFTDGSSTDQVEISYPIGHRRRRAEGIPVLEAKFSDALRTRFPRARAQHIYDLCQDEAALTAMPLNRFMDLFVV